MNQPREDFLAQDAALELSVNGSPLRALLSFLAARTASCSDSYSPDCLNCSIASCPCAVTTASLCARRLTANKSVTAANMNIFLIFILISS